MKRFLVLFREEDGRTESHAPEAVTAHRLQWQHWLDDLKENNLLLDGHALTVEGRTLTKNGISACEGYYQPGAMVGGYLLIQARHLDHATELISSCPVFEFDGIAEIRVVME